MSRPRLPHPEIVYLEWVDSGWRSGWMSREDAMDSKVYVCSTVGFMLTEDDNIVVVSQSIGKAGGTDDVQAMLSIPKVAITRRIQLRAERK